MPDYHQLVLDEVERILHAAAPTADKLNGALRHLAKYRSALIQQVLMREVGQTVLAGPFEGMVLGSTAAEGCYVPKLLGCYETELHPAIREAAQRDYKAIINIGAAEGYYGIGMARLMPHCIVHCYDTNTAAQAVCLGLAQRNGVADRVRIGGQFNGEDFGSFKDRKTLVICDIEGGEGALLDPKKFNALRGMDIIVEMHDVAECKCSEVVPQRFSETHHVKLLSRRLRDVALPRMMDQVGDLDCLLAVWEWRARPTPWAVMIAK